VKEIDVSVLPGSGSLCATISLPQAFRFSNEIVDRLPIGICICDHEGVLVQYNLRAAELWGQAPDLSARQFRFCGASQVYRPNGQPLSELPLAEVLRTGRWLRDREVVFERSDGSRVSVLCNVDPLFDASGQLIGAMNCFQDVTALVSERKREEESRRALVDELNHRVKNTLATVQALATQTIRGGPAKEEREMFCARLFALSRAHDLLTHEGWRSADLRSIVHEVLAPHHGRVEVQGPSLRLPPKMALTLTMILHELAINAAKYGALSLSAGRLSLSWLTENSKQGQSLGLTWRESNGPLVKAPERRGFGSRLVERGIVQEMGGTAKIDFDPSGVCCDIRIPLSRG
jgi:PAS domain S-box-containing protein